MKKKFSCSHRNDNLVTLLEGKFNKTKEIMDAVSHAKRISLYRYGERNQEGKVTERAIKGQWIQIKMNEIFHKYERRTVP